MKISQLCLVIKICIILLSSQPISSETTGTPITATIPLTITPTSSPGNLTNSSVPLQQQQQPPSNPTQITCDVNKPNPCPSGLGCGNDRKCSCPGNTIYSLFYQACKIRAGGQGCRISGDCTDNAHCWHNTGCRRYRCNRSGPTVCDCKCGPLEGINGVCNPVGPNDKCSGILRKSNAFTIAIFLITSLFWNL